MTELVRKKEPGSAWNTEADTGGGPPGTGTLADTLANGNNADDFQIKNVADGTDPKDVVTLQQLEDASVPGLAAVLAENEDAGGHDIQTVANVQAQTLNLLGGDDSGPVAKIVPPPGAVNSVAEIGPQNLGLIVSPDGSVQNRADDTVPNSLVALQRGSDAIYVDEDGPHIVGLQRELLTGNEVNIANGAGGDLQWVHVSGDALLDLTDPALPVVVATGVYAITVEVLPSADMTAGGAYQVGFDMDVNNEDASVTATSPPAVTAILQPATCLTLTYFCPAGAALLVNLGNRDGVQDLNFKIQHAVVQRIA